MITRGELAWSFSSRTSLKIVALEQELRKRDRLVAAGTFAAGVAHEIRNPLSAIELNLRLLRDEVRRFRLAGLIRRSISTSFSLKPIGSTGSLPASFSCPGQKK